MKKKFYSILVIVAILFSSSAIVVHAEELAPEILETSSATESITIIEETPEDLSTIEATLRIETTNGVFFDQTFTVTACKPYAASEEYTLNAKCLIDQANGLTTTWNYYGSSAFLNSVNTYANSNDTSTYWGYFINNEYAFDALNEYILNENDEILLVYGVNPLKIEIEQNPILYTTSTIHVYEFGYDESWNPTWILSNSSTVFVDGAPTGITHDGTAEIVFDEHGNHVVHATKEGFTRSNVLLVETTLPTVEATLYTVANNSILFHDTVSVVACKANENSEIYTLNAKCLIDQANGLTTTWNYYGTDAFLDSVNGYTNDFLNNLFWGYFINSEYGMTALNTLVLQQDDEVLLNYNTTPLKLEFSTTTPRVGNSVTISVYEFGLDESWNPIWIPSNSSMVSINGEMHTLESNTYTLSITTTSPYTVIATKPGHVTIEKTLTAEHTPTPPPSSGGGGGSCCTITNPVEGMIAFLDAKQNSDGSFGTTAFLSDWAALAYGSWTGVSSGKNKLEAYLQTDPNPLDGPNRTTNYARRAMALMALGINPYTGTATNYVEKILLGFDGTQFGEVGLINDDIFALMSLLRAGYSYNDSIITSTAKYIIANQNSSGSFGSVDLTGAAIQSLELISKETEVEQSLTKAKTYLKNAQQNNGGFGNIYGTSWVIQGISALDEQSDNWKMGNNSPKTFIIGQQASDGGLLNGDSTTNRIWATSYAIPALLDKSWATILTSFNKTNTNGGTGNSEGTESNTTTPSTITTPTSTPTTTSTFEVLPEEIEPFIITLNDVVTEESVVVTTEANEHSRTIRGERIHDETTSTSSTTTEETTEIANESEDKQSTQELPIKKYIFWSSLATFLIVLSYALLLKPKTSKK